MQSPGGSFLQYTGQDDADERDDDEVLLLQFEESDYAPENQAVDASGHFDVCSQQSTATSTTAPRQLDSFEEYPPSYRHPPSNLLWPRSDGYSADLKNFEVSDESDREQGSDDDETLYFADTIVDQKCLSVGDECLCLDSRDGQQWVATIKKKTGRHALVHYKGWSKSCDDWVSLSSISPKPAQAVLDRIKIYNSCTKTFNSNSRAVAPAVYVPPCSTGDDELECHSRNDCRGVEPVNAKNRNGCVIGWNAICWRGDSKQFIASSPFHSVDEAAKAWDASAASGSNGFVNFGSWVNFPPQQSFKTPKFPLGSRAMLARKGKARQAVGVVSAFLGRGKYLVKPDEGESTVVSLPSPMVTIVPRPQYRVSDKVEDLDELSLQIALRKLHSVCEKYPATHVLGALGMAIGGVRTLWRQCHRSGILLHQSCAYSTSSFDVLKPLAQALLVSSLACVATEGNPITLQTPDEISEKNLCSENVSTNDAIRYSITIKDRKNSMRAVVNGDERASKVGKSSTDDLEALLRFEGNVESSVRSMQSSEACKSQRTSIVDQGLMVDLQTDKTVQLFVGEVVLGANCEKDRRIEIDNDCFRSVSSDVDISLDSSLLPPVDIGSAEIKSQRDPLVPDAREEEKLHTISADTKVLNGSTLSLTVSSETQAHDLIRKSQDSAIQPLNLEYVEVRNDSAASDEGPKELARNPTALTDLDADDGHDMCDANQQHQDPAICDSRICDDQFVGSMLKSNELSWTPHSPLLPLISRDTHECVSKVSCHVKPENDLKRTRDAIPEKAKNTPDPTSPCRRALRPAKVMPIAHHPANQTNVEDAPLRQKMKRSAVRNVLSDEADVLNSGQRVEVRCKGEWWMAHVERRAAGQAQVRYLGADGGYGASEWVKEDRIRPVQTQPESECNLDAHKLIGVSAIDGEQGLTLWSASIKIRNKEVRVGTFTTLKEAAEAYDMAALQHASDGLVRLNQPQMRDHYMVIIQGKNTQPAPFESVCTATEKKRNTRTTKSEVVLGQRMPSVAARPSGRHAKRNADGSPSDCRPLGDCRVAPNTNRPANDSRSDSFSKGRSAKSAISQAGKSTVALKRGRASKQKVGSTLPPGGCSLQQRPNESSLGERKEVVEEAVETQESGCSNDGLERMGSVSPNIGPSDTPETVSRHGHDGMTPLRGMEKTKSCSRARSLIASASGVDLSNAMSSDSILSESSSEGDVGIQRSDSGQLSADKKHDISGGSSVSGVSDCRPIQFIDIGPHLMNDIFPSLATQEERENDVHHQGPTECMPAGFFLQQQEHSPMEISDIYVQVHPVNCCLSPNVQHSQSSKPQDVLPIPPPVEHGAVIPNCQPQEKIGLVQVFEDAERIYQSNGLLETPLPGSAASAMEQKHDASLNCSVATNTAKSDSCSLESCVGVIPIIGFEAQAVGTPHLLIASNDERCEPTAVADGLLSGTALGGVEDQNHLVQGPQSTYDTGAVSPYKVTHVPYNSKAAQEEHQRLDHGATDGCCGLSLHAASDAFGIPSVWDGAAQEHHPRQQIARDYEVDSRSDQAPKTGAANDSDSLSPEDLLFGNLGHLQDNFGSCGAADSAGKDLLFGDPADTGHAPDDAQSCTQAACGDALGSKRRRLMADKAQSMPFVGS